MATEGVKDDKSIKEEVIEAVTLDNAKELHYAFEDLFLNIKVL